MDPPDALQEDALGGALPHFYARASCSAVLIGCDQQVPDLVLVHLHKVHLDRGTTHNLDQTRNAAEEEQKLPRMSAQLQGLQATDVPSL